MKPDATNIYVGDIIFTRWPGFDAKLTTWVTQGHAAHEEQICCTDEYHGVTSVIAASGSMNRMNIWEWESRKHYFERTNTEWCRYTPTTQLTEKQMSILHDFYEEAQNTFKYSKAELMLQGLDSLRNWLFKIPYDSSRAVHFRKMGNIIKSKVICSKVANIGLVRLGLLPEWAEYWSPSDTLNKFRSSTTWKLTEATEGFFSKKDGKEA